MHHTFWSIGLWFVPLEAGCFSWKYIHLEIHWGKRRLLKDLHQQYEHRFHGAWKMLSPRLQASILLLLLIWHILDCGFHKEADHQLSCQLEHQVGKILFHRLQLKKHPSSRNCLWFDQLWQRLALQHRTSNCQLLLDGCLHVKEYWWKDRNHHLDVWEINHLSLDCIHHRSMPPYLWYH